MCEIITKEIPCKNNSAKYELLIFCKTTGKKISVTNEHGMYCEDLCGIEKDKNVKETIMDFIHEMENRFETGENLNEKIICFVCGKEIENEDDVNYCNNCDGGICQKCSRFKQHQGFEEIFCPGCFKSASKLKMF